MNIVLRLLLGVAIVLTADIPHRGPDCGEFLSIKPCIPLSQELEEVLVLVGQMQPHEALSRDGEYMNPDEVGEDPACRRVLNARAFVVRKGGRLLLQDRADAVFEGCLDEPTPGPDHQQGHDALRFFQRAGGRQKLRSFQEAKPALCLGVPFGAGEHGRRSSRALVPFVRREAKTAVLVHTRLAVRAPRREGSGDRVDALGGLGARAGAPPLPILGRGADGTVREQCGLHVVGQTRQGLSGIRFTGKGRATQCLEGFDFVGTLLAPRLVDRALGLRLARRGIDEHPALRDTALARRHDVRAIAFRERCHGLGIGLGQDGLSCLPGRWHAGAPREAGLGQLVQMLGPIERPVGHEIGGGAGVWSCAIGSLMTWPNAWPS
jgi:hypothetical protein